jgi:hypothetical protein
VVGGRIGEACHIEHEVRCSLGRDVGVQRNHTWRSYLIIIDVALGTTLAGCLTFFL